VSQSEPSHPELPRGLLFAERYEIEAIIGRGGMGAVYRARDLALGESIALKVLAQGSDAGVAEIMRFRQEVRLARKVTHPNVARVFDIGEHEGLVYLTMELLAGDTLRQALRQRGALPPAEAARVARALCDGLRAAHAAGVVHRDLKPANVLLEPGGRVVIMDFGIARSLTEASGLTVGVIGTPTYMAPEQLFSGDVDARTDIYALGLVIHEMLAGVRPGGAVTHALPPALAELVRRCTAPLADARPSSVDEVARALAEAGFSPEASPHPRDGGEATARLAPLRDADTRPLGRAPEPSLTTGTREPALAVLPFRYRGPKEEEGFGDAITDDLVDVLARTRGMRVLGSGATARYRDARDPRDIGRDLAASAVIDGSAQIAGDRVRITVRLLETAGGVQLWSERYDGDLGDLLTLQETIAHRVAEELRLELTTLSHRGAAPAAAIELYLDGRHRVRAFEYEGAAAAAQSLEQALALAPDFAPALAAHAIACLRAWFFDTESGVDWEAAAQRAVARALERAEALAETHLAAGILATHGGEYRAAARAIDRALSIAPTYADAHEYLGMLQCESGRAAEGVKRLRHAGSLDPTLMYSGVIQARQHALDGRWDAAEAKLVELDRLHGPVIARLTLAQRIRIAAWRGDRETLRRAVAEQSPRESPNWRVVRLYARALGGEMSNAEVREAMRQALSQFHNPRFWSLGEQLATEIYAARGEIEEARLHLSRAATSVLVDLEWLDRCPILAPLRELAGWDDIRRRVRARAEAVWST